MLVSVKSMLALVFLLLGAQHASGLRRRTERTQSDDGLSTSWGLDRVGAGPARRGKFQGRGIHIFIADSGVRTTHHDFGGRAFPAVDFTGFWGEAKECNGDLSCAVDTGGQGTFCAGIAAGTTYGVASQAMVHAVKIVKDDGGSTVGRLTSALNWMAASDLRPAVGSFTYYGARYEPVCELGCPSSVKNAVDAAIEAGVTIVVSAGSSVGVEAVDACRNIPAFVPSAITVGATYRNAGYDVKWARSNFGSCVDLWAPGPGVESITNTDDTATATTASFGHIQRVGPAVAHVAGGAARVLERNPDFKAPQVKKQLLADASVNYIHSLSPDDTNKLLYVGDDAPPAAGMVDQSLAEVSWSSSAMQSENGLPARGTGLTVGAWKADGGLMYDGSVMDESCVFYFNVTQIWGKDEGQIRLWFDEEKSVIAGKPFRQWVAWDIPGRTRTYPYDMQYMNVGTRGYFGMGDDAGLDRFQLCNIDGVCYWRMLIEGNQNKIKLLVPGGNGRYAEMRNPMQKV